MGMYNLLHGENEDSDLLLQALGLGRGDFARYRDVWVSEDSLIAVYTRLGGGNSECECDDPDTHDGGEGCYVPTIERLRQHPRYRRDRDDDFDCTYKTFFFEPPDSIPDDYPRGPDGDERWARTLAALEAKKPEATS